MEKTEYWNFAVVGCDSNDISHYIGVVNTYDEALKLKKSAILIGWRHVAIFDAALQEVLGDPATRQRKQPLTSGSE